MITFRQPTLLAALLLGLAATPSLAQTTGPVVYNLEDASGYTEGCYPPCLCPIFFQDAFVGTYVLQYTTSDPAGYDHYSVTNVDWFVGISMPDHVTGSGEYIRGGQFALLEQLVLDLSLNGATPVHFDSGLVTPQGVFPHIDIAISMNGMYCYDRVFSLVSAPGAPGAGFCSGDGTATACPCGNAGAPGNGCANSVNTAGANLFGNGLPSLGADSVQLVSTGTPNASLLFFQGTLRINAGNGAVFGDGLRCVGGTVKRLKTLAAVGGQAQIPGPSDPTLSTMGAITAPGVYEYQVWYRNAAAFCTNSTFNLTNGYEIAWTP